MSRLKLSGKWLGAFVGVGVLVLAGGIAYAAIPDGNGVIHGCYQKSSGALRVIDTATGGKCSSSERVLDWNQTGPQGDPGEPGLSGYEVVEGDPFTNNGGSVGVVALCPDGTTPIGGGFTGSNGDILIYESYPSVDENGWRISANFGVSQMTVTPYAVCASVAD